MAALDEVKVNSPFLSTQQAVIALVKSALWQWIHQNGDKTVRLKIWIISKTFKISDLHAVFELLLGPDTSVS